MEVGLPAVFVLLLVAPEGEWVGEMKPAGDEPAGKYELREDVDVSEARGVSTTPIVCSALLSSLSAPAVR